MYVLLIVLWVVGAWGPIIFLHGITSLAVTALVSSFVGIGLNQTWIDRHEDR